ncbi:unnamed protein product [Brachionus calyciflorus]|uniref:Alcohol acetyltransferase n=1 Tax=Brachionus calyciflorus TaxID=104777 RepID=A0A813VH67_9BILA|nr:unnamed protein product [Brachionus calyciflorus]
MSLIQPISELNNYQMIRKLGESECLYDHEVIHGNLYLTRTFLVHVKKGDINMNLARKACSFWCSKNPLLKAQIFRSDLSKYDRYFVKYDNEILFEKFKNVKLITSEDEFEWKELMDREIVTPFDLKKDPLWRLLIIKLLNQKNLEFNYAFILTTQHTIGDGRNIFTLGIEFLNILSKLVEDENFNLIEESKISKFSAEDLIESKKFIFGEEKNENIFDNLNRGLECFGDKLNGQHGKMEYFKIPKEKLEKLKLIMKNHSRHSKLSGIISGLIFLGQKNIMKKFNIKQQRCQFIILASVREKLGIDNSYGGVFSSEVNQCLDFDLNINNFWDFVEKQSLELHDSIRKNLDIKIFEKTDESWENILQNKYDEGFLNGIISNLGVMSSTSSDKIKVVEHYVRMPAVYGRISSTMFNGISTVNGTLCWAISYNEKYFTKKFQTELIDEINGIVDTLISKGEK